MSDFAIRVEGLGKEYRIGHKRATSLREIFAKKRNNAESFWALKDVSFEVAPGEAVGIIGRNGAGKSTLLKILSRITWPTRGRFEINGRVSSLLEVGTGFHPELTGRENTFLNGTILGMTRSEVKAKFDEIVDFSGIEKFIDTPVKHYSSGMKVRLAFAVAAHLEPEILIIDEVLAVGDAEFQKKCLGKMDEVSKREGRTIVFVSHNLNSLSLLCKTGLVLHGGEVSMIGDITESIRHYSEQVSTNVARKTSHQFGKYVSRAEVCNHHRANARFSYGDDIIVDIYTTGLFSPKIHQIGFYVIDYQGNKIGAVTNRMVSVVNKRNGREKKTRFVLKSPPIMEGEYSVDIVVSNKEGGRLEFLPTAMTFSILESDFYRTGSKITSSLGKIYFHFEILEFS